VHSLSSLPLIGQVLFPSAALLCGMLGGYEFPLASRLFFASGPKRRAGTLYALDLAGSCLGAIFFSVYLVPVFGFFRTAVLIALVSLAPALMAILSAAPAGQETALAREAVHRIPQP
jgi:predicted membrane-bound spermidine synthase